MMIPTGNPYIPPHMREVKEIRYLITKKTEGAAGLEYDFFSPDDVEVTKADDTQHGTWGWRGRNNTNT